MTGGECGSCHSPPVMCDLLPFQLLLGAWWEVKGEALASNGADWGQHNCVDG